MIKIILDNQIEEVLQNIKTILSTQKNTVPLMRDFGIDPNLIDSLLSPAFEQKLKNHIITQIQTYEPRAKVSKIKLYTENEKVYIKLNLTINEAQYELTHRL